MRRVTDGDRVGGGARDGCVGALGAADGGRGAGARGDDALQRRKLGRGAARTCARRRRRVLREARGLSALDLDDAFARFVGAAGCRWRSVGRV